MEAAILRHRLASVAYDGLRDRLSVEYVETGADVLFRARYGCYLTLGFAPEQALLLAASAETTVLDAVRLVERGCAHDVALAILL